MRRPTRTPSGVRLTEKIVLSVALVALAAALVGVGAFAVFTDTESVSQTTTSGTVTVDLGSPGATNRLSVGATDLAAGDAVERTVELANSGSVALADVKLTTTATASSLLDTDTTDGLQMVVERCSVAWTESGPPYAYTCGGTTETVLASRPVIGANLALANLDLSAGADNFLRVTLTLPSAAPDTLQAQSSTISYGFTATQRTGQAQ
ncbi:MAG: CalY family protein [Acidimicrobiia bacterium]|nr:CalY family protein [Acidimicrobiia bacterium]